MLSVKRSDARTSDTASPSVSLRKVRRRPTASSVAGGASFLASRRRLLKSRPELQIRSTQLEREGSPPPRMRLAQAMLSRTKDRLLKSWPELQIRIMQLQREGSPPPGVRLAQAKLSRKSNQIARG